ncbi:hypothetical protein [Deinococcus marmoris]|uniref:hypothetical protein n=1 Tax=Deinococcus marmoris TaxID=249408 RepID=UPI0004967CF8|nr:hypothetical protein [Deinococcus marmoris]
MKPNEHTLNELTLNAKLLAQVSTPPAALLAHAPGPQAPARTEDLTLYGLDDGGYTVISATQAADAPADTTVRTFGDVAELQDALGTGPLASALYHLADLPAPCMLDGSGHLTISAATIHCVAWAETTLEQPKKFLMGYGDLTPEAYLSEMNNWWKVVGSDMDHFPTTFADIGALRRHIEQHATQVSGDEQARCLALWQAMTETQAMRAVQELQEGVCGPVSV